LSLINAYLNILDNILNIPGTTCYQKDMRIVKAYAMKSLHVLIEANFSQNTLP